MLFTRRQAQTLMNQFNNLSINKKFQMADAVNYVLSPFEVSKNIGDSQGLKLYI